MQMTFGWSPRHVMQRSEPHERNPCAPKFEERTPVESLTTRRERPQSNMGFGEKMFKLKAEDETTFYSSVERKAPVLLSQNRRTYVCG